MGTVIGSCSNGKLPNSESLNAKLNDDDSNENDDEVTSSSSDDTSVRSDNSSPQNDLSSANPDLTSGGQTTSSNQQTSSNSNPTQEPVAEAPEKDDDSGEIRNEEKPVEEEQEKEVVVEDPVENQVGDVPAAAMPVEEPAKDEKEPIAAEEKEVEVPAPAEKEPAKDEEEPIAAEEKPELAGPAEEPAKDEEAKPVKKEEVPVVKKTVVISELKVEHFDKIWNSGSWNNWVGARLIKGISLGKDVTISQNTYKALWDKKSDRKNVRVPYGKVTFEKFSGVEIFPSTAKGTETNDCLKQIKKENMV